MKKVIIVDHRVEKGIDRLPKKVKIKFQAVFYKLESLGLLKEPYSKKIKNVRGLYELRIRINGQWRMMYAYLDRDNAVVMLSLFRKKTQRTLSKEIKKAMNRLKNYI